MHTPMIRVTPRNAGSSDEKQYLPLDDCQGGWMIACRIVFFDDISNIKLYYYGKRWKRKKTT